MQPAINVASIRRSESLIGQCAFMFGSLCESVGDRLGSPEGDRIGAGARLAPPVAEPLEEPGDQTCDEAREEVHRISSTDRAEWW